MVSPEERLLIGLKVLEKLKPELRLRRERLSSSQAFENSADYNPNAVDYFPSGQFDIPTLQEMLAQAGELPPYSLLLGACEDGLPFLLDLNNPTPGSLLITADPGTGKTRLLRAILASAILLNAPSEASFNIIASRPQEYASLALEDHCEGVFSADDPGIDDFIVALSYLVEERSRNGSFGPAMVLAIDDLATLLQSLSRRASGRLFSIIQRGPSQRVWVAATLSSDQAGTVDGRLLSSFRTCLVGSIASPDLAEAFCEMGQPVATELEPGCQFCVPFGGVWIRFWICDTE